MNRGAELLKAARGSQRSKARRLDVSQAYVSQLAAGKKIPGDKMRKTLLETYRIPPGAWDELVEKEAPRKTAPPPSTRRERPEDAGTVATAPQPKARSAKPSFPAPTAPSGSKGSLEGTSDPESPALGGGSVVERARVLLAYLAVPGRTTQELAQAREIRAALTFEARLVGAMTTKAKLHEHPDWNAHLDELVTVLARVPGALDALDAFLARTGERSAAA